MDVLASENYLITKAKTATDSSLAKAWILTAKKLYPENFGVQFEAYRLEKNANDYDEAAKCFSYVIQTFQNQPSELWNEVSQLTSALRIPEGSTTSEQDFYVKMFQHIPYEIQHKILLLTANHSENSLEHCKLILLLLKRFPQAIHTHSPRLLETLIQGISTNQLHFRDMLVQETLPMLMIKPPELPSAIVNRIMAIAFEYYINQMFSKDIELDKLPIINECWKKIFETYELCSRILKWEPFLPYNCDWSKDVYWQKLFQIVTSLPPRPSENKQILFSATIIFVMSLQNYIQNVKHKIDDAEIDFILVEGLKDTPFDLKRRKSDTTIEAPRITIYPPCTQETPICMVTAAQCWQLLHSNEILQSDFSKLLRSVPLSNWINRFLIDLAIYLGRNEEAHSLLKDTKCSNIEKNVRLMSLAAAQPTFNIQTFDLLMKILSDIPTITGQLLKNISLNISGRHLLLLPMTKHGILQYCTKIISNALKQKLLTSSTCNDSLLGNLLVMLQLDWPEEQHTVEQIFNIIRSRGQFIYLQFTSYIICPDMIEEFISMWYPHGGDVHLEFTLPQTNLGTTRRIGTRGADKGVKDDFKLIMRQQMLKSNEDINMIILQFLKQEHMKLVQNIFEK